MRTETILLSTLLLLCSPTLTAQESIREVPPGREVRDSKLLSPNATDVWKIEAEPDEVLRCVVDSGAFDPVLELFDADGKSLGQDDGKGTRSELCVRLQHKGACEFRVHGFQGSGGGHYDFWLQRYRTEALAADGEASHTFGQECWWHFRVALHEGDLLVPAVGGDGHLTSVFDSDNHGVADFHGGFAAPHQGEYYLRVEGPEGHQCSITTQLARQRAMPANGGAEDRVPPFGFDIWRVPMQAGGAYLLDVAMPEAGLEFDWRERRQGQEPSWVFPGHLDKGGRLHRWVVARRDCGFEILLRNRGDQAVPYRMAWTAPAAVLATGAARPAKLALGHGDLYQLDLTAGDVVRLRMTSAAFDARFDLWDPLGKVLARIDDRSPLDRDAEHTLLVERSGRYHLLAVCEGGGGSGEYAVQAEVLPVPELHLGVAQQIEVRDGGTAYVHLQLQAGQEVWLSARSTAFDAGLSVLDPTGNGAFACEGGGRGGDVLVAYVAAHTGVHTLLVHSRGGAGQGEVKVIAP